MNSKYKPTIGLESTHPKDIPSEHSEIPVGILKTGSTRM